MNNRKNKPMSYKMLKFIEIKGKNRRVNIYLVELSNGDKVFDVLTKRLQNRLTRNITEVKARYTIESFKVLYDAMSMFMNESETVNKLINKELAALDSSQYTGATNID
tara:strand:- start:1478 stop:1801 length:324 start_codon:yes stop_codon:yes gene_type:complete